MDNNHGIAEDDNREDLLEGFDILESERDFLLYLLEVAPAEEVDALNRIAHTESVEELDFYVVPAPRSTVEKFAHAHPFWSQGQRLDIGKSIDSSQAEMLRFNRDVYDYARAAGMGQHQAKVEVMRATAAWRKERGFGLVGVLDEWGEEYMARSEIHARSPVLVARNSMSLASSGATEVETSKKRKISSLEEPAPQSLSNEVVQPDVAEARRLRRLAKKERKRIARDMRKQLDSSKAAVECSEHTEDCSSRFSLLPMPDTAEQETVTRLAKKKMKSKLGPTTSLYFTKPQGEYATKAKGLPEATISSDNNKKARKRHRTAGRVRSESDASQAIAVSTKMVAVEEVKEAEGRPMAINPSPTEAATSTHAPNLASNSLHHTKYSAEAALEIGEKKPKRKRKRNQNRLLQEETTVFGVQSKADLPKSNASTISEEAVKFLGEKRSPKQAFIENLQGMHEDGSELLSEVHGENGEGIKAEAKRKRTRRRKLPREEVLVLNQFQDSMPSGHNGEIPIVPNDGGADPEKQDNIQHEPRPKKRRRKERPRKNEHILLDESQNSVKKSHAEIPIVERHPELGKYQLNSEAAPEHEEVSPSSKKKRRDRGRKSEGNKKQTLEYVGSKGLEENAVVEPLTELANTNAKQPNEGRREEVQGIIRESDEESEMDIDAPSLREQSKVYHS